MADRTAELPFTPDDLKSDPLVTRLRRTEETLADQLIQRRLEGDRIALLQVQNEDLRETIRGLRRALDAFRGSADEIRRPTSRFRRR